MRKNINEYIRSRRVIAEITPEELAIFCNLSIAEYGDIEGYDDELYMVVPLKTVACLCDHLDITLYNLYDCSYNSVLLSKDCIKNKAYENNISISDLSNFIVIEDSYIILVMEDILNIGNWVMDSIILLANKLGMDLGSILMSYSEYRRRYN